VKVEEMKMVRAGQSIILNLRESKNYGDKQQLHFFRIALGSSNECIACYEIYERFCGEVPNELKDKLDYECRMLFNLITKVERLTSTSEVLI
jgi:four helix bundle protein